MRKSFVVLSGTSMAVRRERAPSATEALRLVLDNMKLRRPRVKIEDDRGNPVSFFQLTEIAASEKQLPHHS
jgi:hypothetical protein